MSRIELDELAKVDAMRYLTLFQSKESL